MHILIFISKENMRKQDNIAEGCIRPTSKPYVLEFQLPPPDVNLRCVCPKMHKFE